jgi:hypothetical protein
MNHEARRTQYDNFTTEHAEYTERLFQTASVSFVFSVVCKSIAVLGDLVVTNPFDCGV